MRLEEERISLSLFKLLLWTFGINYGYMMVDDNFGSNYEELDVHLSEHELGFI